MRTIDSKCFRYSDLSQVDRKIGQLVDPLPTGTLVHVAWRLVDAGEQKASADMPYISHGEQGDKPLRMNIFAKILSGPHAGQGWYEYILLPVDIQERCGKMLTQSLRDDCKSDARILKHMLLSSRSQPFSTTEGLDQVDFAWFDGLEACVKIKNYWGLDEDNKQFVKTIIDAVIDPTDPICERIKNAGEIPPQEYPATSSEPAEPQALAAREPLRVPDTEKLIAILDKHLHGK